MPRRQRQKKMEETMGTEDSSTVESESGSVRKKKRCSITDIYDMIKEYPDESKTEIYQNCSSRGLKMKK